MKMDISRVVEIPTDPSMTVERRYLFPELISSAQTVGAADSSGVVIVANGGTLRSFDYIQAILDDGGSLHIPYAGNESYFAGAGSYMRLNPRNADEVEVVSNNGDYGRIPRAELEDTLKAIAPIQGLDAILQGDPHNLGKETI